MQSLELNLLLRDHMYSSFALLCLLCSVAWQIFKHLNGPLRHITGLRLSKITKLPLFIQSFRGNRAKWIIQQHHVYGPVIRIAPNKICVASAEGIKTIYSNKAKKLSVYEGFRYYDVKMCIGLQDLKSAHMRRKGMLPAFSPQNLIRMEPVIRHHPEKFLKWLEKFDASGDYIDCFRWFRCLTFDVVADIAFGQQIGMLVNEDDNFIQQVEFGIKRNGLVLLAHLPAVAARPNSFIGWTISIPHPIVEGFESCDCAKLDQCG